MDISHYNDDNIRVNDYSFCAMSINFHVCDTYVSEYFSIHDRSWNLQFQQKAILLSSLIVLLLSGPPIEVFVVIVNDSF